MPIIHVLSDIHLESGPFTPPPTDADLVVLAGDIAGGNEGLHWARETFPDRRPVIYLPGNHEYYGQRLERMAVELRACANELGIIWLDNDTVELELADERIRIIGSTLWTDFELFGSRMDQVGDALLAARIKIADFSTIIYGTRGFLRPEKTVEFHRISREYIRSELDKPFDGKTVVVTHHAPSWSSVARRWQHDIVSACFASRCEDLVGKANLWIHGHTHASFDYAIGDRPDRGQVVCNPRGYAYSGTPENPDFNPGFVIGI